MLGLGLGLNRNRVSGSTPFDLSDYGTLITWLKNENGMLGNQWDDFSGNGNHAKQSSGSSQPTLNPTGINGLPTLDFDGTDDYFYFDSMPKPKYFCEIAVFQVDDIANAGVLTQTYAGTVGSIWGSFNLSAGGSGKVAGYNSDGSGYTTSISTSAILINNTPLVLISKYIDGETTHHLFKNGISVPVIESTTGASTNDGTAPTFVIGRYGDLNIAFFKGKLAEYAMWGGNNLSDIPTDINILL